MTRACSLIRFLILCGVIIILGCGCVGTPLTGTEVPLDDVTINPTGGKTSVSDVTPTPEQLLPTFIDHAVDIDFDTVSGLSIFDIDADGRQDIVGAAFGDNEVAWWRNEGGSPVAFTKNSIDGEYDSAIYVSVVDFEGDGDGDVAASAYYGGEITWWRNEGGQPISWEKILIAADLGQALGIQFVDLDQDGDYDVLGTTIEPDRLIWWENTDPDGNGEVWQSHVIDDQRLVFPQSVDTADLDGDGDRDIVVAATGSNDIVWWSNEGGNPITWSLHILEDNFLYAHWVYVIDLDQDSKLDILGAAYRGEQLGHSLVWWRNEGGDPLVFTSIVIAEKFDGSMTIQAADIDLDGDYDIVATANDLHQVAWWRNNGGEMMVWEKEVIQSSFSGAWPLYLGDLDGDGDVDVIAGADKSNRIFWWENTTKYQAP